MSEPSDLTPDLRTEVRKLCAAVDSTDPCALPPLAGLTTAQADGLACVWCADADPVDEQVPVGRSETGTQVFACDGWCEANTRVWRVFERSVPDHELVGDGFAAFRDYDELVLRETRTELQADQSSSENGR